MKNFDLKACGVSEISVREMQEIDGGILGFLIWIACGIAYDIISNPVESAKSFQAGMEAAQNLMR